MTPDKQLPKDQGQKPRSSSTQRKVRPASDYTGGGLASRKLFGDPTGDEWYEDLAYGMVPLGSLMQRANDDAEFGDDDSFESEPGLLDYLDVIPGAGALKALPEAKMALTSLTGIPLQSLLREIGSFYTKHSPVSKEVGEAFAKRGMKMGEQAASNVATTFGKKSSPNPNFNIDFIHPNYKSKMNDLNGYYRGYRQATKDEMPNASNTREIFVRNTGDADQMARTLMHEGGGHGFSAELEKFSTPQGAYTLGMPDNGFAGKSVNKDYAKGLKGLIEGLDISEDPKLAANFIAEMNMHPGLMKLYDHFKKVPADQRLDELSLFPDLEKYLDSSPNAEVFQSWNHPMDPRVEKFTRQVGNSAFPPASNDDLMMMLAGAEDAGGNGPMSRLFERLGHYSDPDDIAAETFARAVARAGDDYVPPVLFDLDRKAKIMDILNQPNRRLPGNGAVTDLNFDFLGSSVGGKKKPKGW